MFYFLINQFPSCSKSLPSILGGLPCFKLQFSLGAKSGRHSKTLVLGQAALIFAPYKWYKCILLYEISLCKLGHISRWNTFLSTPQCLLLMIVLLSATSTLVDSASNKTDCDSNPQKVQVHRLLVSNFLVLCYVSSRPIRHL